MEIFKKMHGAGYYRQDADAIRADTARSAELESLLMEKLERWDALESRARGGA